MLKKVIKYKDFNGTEREETFYFNMTETELGELDIDAGGTLAHRLVRIVQTQNGAEMAKFIKELIVRSYGEKSDDGRRFVKSKEISEAFSQTEAYTELFMELATDADAAGIFINGIIPADLVEQAKEEIAKANLSVVDGSTSTNS